jgi:small subunit ribosomal protein S8
MMTDPISDLLIRIKNAGMAQHDQLTVPYSRLKEDLVKLMIVTGHVGGLAVTGETTKRALEIKAPKIKSVRRMSKPGMRLYVDHQNLKRYLKRRGVTILSTSKGLMTAKDAFKKKLGGELICHLI